MDPIASRIAAVRERIVTAAQHAGRSADEIRLVGVTKTHPPETIARALAAGLTDFGENRVQEAEAKIVALAAERERITWHLIGHLQRNKAKRAVALFDTIHSIDSLRLAEATDRAVATEAGGPENTETRKSELHLSRSLSCPILIQVNVSGEASKEGFTLAGWEQQPPLLNAFFSEVEAVLALPNLRVRGLMTIAPWSDDPETARPIFRSVRRLRDRLAQRFPQGEWTELSMGMTGDFAVAIEEGATLVRIGRAIFGER